MTKYEIKIKRKGEPPVTLEAEGNKITFDDGMTFFQPSHTCSVILAIFELMENEGLEWIRVDEK